MGNDANLKERIRRGDIVIGVNVPIGSTKSQFEDILGKDDYGFATCDSQHSPFSEHMLVDHCNVADEVGIPIHFRIKHTQLAFLVGNIADLGPAFIEIARRPARSTSSRSRSSTTGPATPSGGMKTSACKSNPARHRKRTMPGVDLHLEFDLHPHHPFKTDDDCIKHVMDQVNVGRQDELPIRRS